LQNTPVQNNKTFIKNIPKRTMDPFKHWIGKYDSALDDLLAQGLVERMGEGDKAMYRLSEKGAKKGKKKRDQI
jgi:DNA-binding PadR family transcriptional regulator